jgi:starvation-inducible outer membrane lipoprotein
MRAIPIIALVGLMALLVLLAGCTTLPADPTKMSPEQLEQWVKDKSASISCVVARNATGTVVMSMANLDKTTFKNGSLTVKPSSDCEMTITAEGAAKAASAP